MWNFATCPNPQATSTYALESAINARAVDNIYKNQTNPDWYTWDDLQTLLSDMDDAANNMEQGHQGLYLGFGKLRHLGDVYELGDIWEGRTLNETLYIDTRTPYTIVSVFAKHVAGAVGTMSLIQLQAYRISRQGAAGQSKRAASRWLCVHASLCHCPLNLIPPCACPPQSDLNSLWLMGNAFIASTREIVSNYLLIANQTLNNFMLNRDWQYMNLNGTYSGRQRRASLERYSAPAQVPLLP